MGTESDRSTAAFAVSGAGQGAAWVEMAGDGKFFVVTSGVGRSEAVAIEELIGQICRQLGIDAEALGRDGNWKHGRWGIGRVAATIAAAFRASGVVDDFVLDGEEWLVGDSYPRPHYPSESEAVVDCLIYEQPSEGETQGNSVTLGYYLLNFGDVYRVFVLHDDEPLDELPLTAASDTEAMDEFRSLYEQSLPEWTPPEAHLVIPTDELSIEQQLEDACLEWRLSLQDGRILLDTPDQPSVIAPPSVTWGRAALDFLVSCAPSAVQFPSETQVQIQADSQLAPWLPLYLSPEDDSVEISVNGEDWFALGWFGDPHVASPVEEPDPCWARFSWSETASRVSGTDYSEVGPATETLVMIKTFRDETSLDLSFESTADAARTIHEWLMKNKLAEELRNCWPGGEEDPISRGFRALLHNGETAMDWRAPDLLASDWGDDMPGTTDTSEWSFYLTPDPDIRARLTEVYRWAEGEVPVRVEREPAPKPVQTDPYEHVTRKVRQLLAQSHPREALERAKAAYEEALVTETRRAREREEAAAQLELPLDASRQAIFKRVELLAAENPDRSSEYWYVAYDMLPPEVSGPDSALQEVRACQARLAALEDQVRDLGWPSNWDERLCPLWKEEGGTRASAAAWSRAGWGPEVVLTERDMPGLVDASLETRLSAVDVPHK